MVTLSVDKQQLLPLATLMALAVVSVLTLLGLWLRQPAIETDLLQRTRQALAAAGLPTNTIRFSGRDGILTGTVATEEEAQRLQSVVGSVYGVRAVNNHLILAGTEAVATPMPEPLSPLDTPVHTPAQKHPVEQIRLDAIQFDYSRSELDADAIAALDQVVAELKKAPGMKIEVSAHTDNRGTALGNLSVTQARAEVIRNYLLSQGIEAGRVKAQGYGSTRPLADNASEAGRQQNRRIEITVLEE